MIIRPATAGDLDAIASIQSASPQASQWKPTEYLDYTCAVAEEGTVAGFIVTREVVLGEYEILNLAVAPEARRRGVARELLKRVLETGSGEWFLEVRESNFAAIQLYETVGFRVSGKRSSYYSNSRESAIVMRLQR